MVPRLDWVASSAAPPPARGAGAAHLRERDPAHRRARQRIPPQLTNRGGRPERAGQYPLPPQPPPSPSARRSSGNEELCSAASRRAEARVPAAQAQHLRGHPAAQPRGVYPTGALDSSFYRRPTFKARPAQRPGGGRFAAAEMYFNYAGDDSGGTEPADQQARGRRLIRRSTGDLRYSVLIVAACTLVPLGRLGLALHAFSAP